VVFVFRVCLISLNIMTSGFIYAATNNKTSFFLWVYEVPLSTHTTFSSSFIHWWASQLIHILTIVNHSKGNIGVHVFLCDDFISLEYMHINGIVGSYGNYIFSFSKKYP
jgi:hypothetical protein